jgi:mono/diheme cytochrome c family protein
MFEWLKFWEGSKVVIGIVVVPGLLAIGFFLMPFLDRRLERMPWRRPIPALSVALVVLGMVFLGVKSQLDDKQGPIAEQLALQAEQEKDYTAAPFRPYVEPKGEVVAAVAPTGPVSPLVGVGRGIFNQRGCSGCHGALGAGTTLAPSLVGVIVKFGHEQLAALLRNPNPRMRAGHMPAVDASPNEMAALVAYLGVLGTNAASQPEERHTPQMRIHLDVRKDRVAPQKLDFAAAAGPAAGSSNSLSASVAEDPPDTKSGNTIESIATGQKLFLKRACFTCHGRGGGGGAAPALAPIVVQLSDSQLREVLQKPTAKMKEGGMPPLQATSEELEMLLAYLRTLPAPRQ